MKTSSHSAVYVYCVFRAASRPRLAGVPAGVPEAVRPELQAVARGTWLVTSTVPLDVYDPANLEPRLRDLDWVAQVAVAHEAVNEFFTRASGAVVVPMKLFTMFSSVEKAIEDVRARRTAIDRVMRRIAGCEEWGLRVTRRPVVERSGAARPATGAEFLQSRKAARDAASNARTEALDAAAAAYKQLARYAKDARKRTGGGEPGTNPPVLEAAFLVRATGRTKFTREVRRQGPILAKAGADLTLTGPWPAYNFVGEER